MFKNHQPLSMIFCMGLPDIICCPTGKHWLPNWDGLRVPPSLGNTHKTAEFLEMLFQIFLQVPNRDTHLQTSFKSYLFNPFYCFGSNTPGMVYILNHGCMLASASISWHWWTPKHESGALALGNILSDTQSCNIVLYPSLPGNPTDQPYSC